MKLFGTVQSFDTIKGNGEIKPEVGSDLIRFHKSAIAWANAASVTGVPVKCAISSTNARIMRCAASRAQPSVSDVGSGPRKTGVSGTNARTTSTAPRSCVH